MQTFEWTRQFETDIPSVDDQHRHLVDLINQLGQALNDRELNARSLTPVVAQLVDYAHFHFEDEERLMKDAGLDQRHIELHQANHRQFLKDIAALDPTRDDAAAQLGTELLDYLVHWLSYHILGQDRDMANQIAAISEGMAPAAAFEQHERKHDAAIQPLLSALHRLMQQLSARNQELAELNRTLEQRVTERTQALSQANDQLEVLSRTDALTGLPNRRHAMQQLHVLWQESADTGKPVSALMIDADNFKEVNDTHGHDAGDKVLIALATELKHALRTDDLIFRLGGDEFLVLCPATDFEGAMQVANGLLERVASMQVTTGSSAWNSSASLGVATRTDAMKSPDDLIKAADDSVYLAKQAGRGCVQSCQSESNHNANP